MWKLICKWFGHRWMRGFWISAENDIFKCRADVCTRCGARANWHVLKKN